MTVSELNKIINAKMTLCRRCNPVTANDDCHIHNLYALAMEQTISEMSPREITETPCTGPVQTMSPGEARKILCDYCAKSRIAKTCGACEVRALSGRK